MDELSFRIALLKRGLSQNGLAVRLGLHPQVLSSIVRGYRKIEADLQLRIARELGLESGELFRTDVEPIQKTRLIMKNFTTT